MRPVRPIWSSTMVAALALSWLVTGGAARAEPPRAIVLVTVDTLRADAVSFAGYERKTTPFLERMAEKGVVLGRAYAPSSWTPPSMASLFTGLYPTSHGVTEGVFSRDRMVISQPILPASLTTLAEGLKAAGYTTIGIPSNRHLSEDLGFAQGFDHYLSRAYFLTAPKVAAKTRELLRRTFGNDWKRRWTEERVFLWIHFFDPHAPYAGRQPWVGAFEPKFLDRPAAFPAGLPWPEIQRLYPRPGPSARDRLRPLYDSEVAFVDTQLGLLSSDLGLEEDDVLFILTSDHGEEFAEHGSLGHGHTLYEELVRVPLLVRWPAGLSRGIRVDDLVGIHDLYPTLLELAGAPSTEAPQARSLVPLLRGEPSTGGSAYFEVSSRTGGGLLIGMIDGDWKVIRDRKAGGTAELFNLAEDPTESADLAGREVDRRRRMELALREWVRGLTPPEQIEERTIEDEELLKELEALGYIGGN